MADAWTELFTDSLPLIRARDYLHGHPSLGGIVTFEGATRGQVDPDHGPLSHLEYDAYGRMAALQLQRLCGQALERWEWGKVVMLHRLGRVGLGEVSVLIGVAAVHRAVAFEACRWLIDALKVEVPIWKRDVFADGFVRWVEPNPGQNAASSDGMITDAGRPE